MSVAFVPQSVRNPKMPVSPETIQKLLDENCHLIQCISEYQAKGKVQECSQYQQVLHRNLVWLATVADSNQSGSQQSILSGTAPDMKDVLSVRRTATPDLSSAVQQRPTKPSTPNQFTSSLPNPPTLAQPVYQQQSNPAYSTTGQQLYQSTHQVSNVSAPNVASTGVPPLQPQQQQPPPQQSMAQPMDAQHMSYSMQQQGQAIPYTQAAQTQPPYSNYQQPPNVQNPAQAQAPYGQVPPQQQPYQQPNQYAQGQYNMYPQHQ